MFKHRTLNIITVISILIVLSLPAYSKYILFPSYNEFLIGHAEEILKVIARNMVEHNGIKSPILVDSPLPTHFLEDVEHIRKTNGLWKVKIFTADGRIVYSTDPLDVGNHTRKKFFPEMFEDDRLRSHIDIKKLNDDNASAPKTHYFIETYVPIKHGDLPIGAFEIYYDITDVKSSLERLKGNEQKVLAPIILLLLAGGLFSSYLAHKNMSELKKSQEKFKELAVIDELTGLLNRRGFVRTLDKQLTIIDRGKMAAFLIFIDLNYFKKINDTFGHEIGDEALRETSRILNRTFRGSDIIGHLGENVIGRLGGDEFAVLATQIVDMDNTGAIHERLEANVMKWNENSKAEYKLSLSFGIAAYSPDNPCSANELINKADVLMYQQKEKRRQSSEKGG